jgi:hypothetical protein
MTNTNKLDEFTTELLTTTIASQKAKREERQALMLASSPWIAQARAMQIKLQESEAK